MNTHMYSSVFFPFQLPIRLFIIGSSLTNCILSITRSFIKFSCHTSLFPFPCPLFIVYILFLPLYISKIETKTRISFQIYIFIYTQKWHFRHDFLDNFDIRLAIFFNLLFFSFSMCVFCMIVNNLDFRYIYISFFVYFTFCMYIFFLAYAFIY